MAAPAECDVAQETNEPLDQARILTEVDHLLDNRRGPGLYDAVVLQDVTTNLYTALQEMAMPYAVTTTFQRASYERNEAGEQRRLFMWLGKHAVEVAMSGKKFHSSQAVLNRVDVEVAEAEHSQRNLREGAPQVFISPRMSSVDAPRDVAEHEHLANDDSVRVSHLVTDARGNVLGRRIESLLVRDIPLAAWVTLLKDPNNIFGKSFDVRNEASALSVMELFEGLELPGDKVPEGPVSLVQAILPYIESETAQASVEQQLLRFRHDQALYRTKATQMAEDWLSFEMSLADSLHAGQATPSILGFINSLQHHWGDVELGNILRHQNDRGGYTMTRQLASLLERAERHLLAAMAAIATSNEQVINQIGAQAAEAIRQREIAISEMHAAGVSPEAVRSYMTDAYRQVASQNIRIGGGCAGIAESTFHSDDGSSDPDGAAADTDENKSSWKWSVGTCRVKNCPSPSPTEVGPCSVCRRCQRVFDAGRDPAKTVAPERPIKKAIARPGARRKLSELALAVA